MAGDFITQKSGEKEISFKQIVLEHQRRILQIASREFTKTDFTKVYGNYTEHIKGSDNALNFIQSVESFASILSPFFDEEMQKKHKKLIRFFNCWIFEFKTLGKEYIDEYSKENSVNNEKLADLLRKHKIIDAKELFLELNKFLMRKDYLKGTVYDEEDPEIVDIEETE